MCICSVFPRYPRLIQSRVSASGKKEAFLRRVQRTTLHTARTLVTYGPQSRHVCRSSAADKQACKGIPGESLIRSIQLSKRWLLASFSRRRIRREHHPSRAALSTISTDPVSFPFSPGLSLARCRLVHSIPPSPRLDCRRHRKPSSFGGDKRA